MENLLSLSEIVARTESLFFCRLERVGIKKFNYETIKVLVRVKDGEPLQLYLDVSLLDRIKEGDTLLVNTLRLSDKIFITRFWILGNDDAKSIDNLLKRVD